MGDTLEIFVMEDQAFNGIYKIREKGDIIFPKLGRVVVAGLAVEAAQQKIQQALQGTQLQSATVIADRISQVPGGNNFEEKPKILVFVTGKVNRPGQHMIAINSGDAVYAYEAVLVAGGVTQFADEKHAYILRKGDQGIRDKIPLNLRSIRQG
ncbi:MAG: polysaccharide biosynthesis/export family protein, partial [Fimbriimonadaceae bacterium]